ncbi:MAG: O-antigen ligase C-terminal domain-containing protein [Burkholderiales bacterium]|nr:O-antigen ligase C-terminal domain-containing protein [Burkholderiales bacterium]
MPPASPRAALLIAALTLPWLWPFTSGPTAATQPYLMAMALAAVALALWPARDPEAGARRAATAWLAAAAVSAAIALLQYLDLETPLFPWVNVAEPRQAFGNLRQPNQLASLLVIGALALRWQVQQGRLARRPAAALLALLMAALAATASRLGLVALLAVLALVWWWARADRIARRSAVATAGRRAEWPTLAAALGLYALAVLALPWLAQALGVAEGRDMLARLRDDSASCGSRWVLWRNVLHLIALKPWLGWGWGELDYAHYITLYPGARFCYILDNAHNLPLHLAVELGVPAALLAGALLAALLWRARPWRAQTPTRQLAWGVLAVVGLHSGVEYPLWYAPFQIAAVIAAWLLWATRESRVPVIPARAGSQLSSPAPSLDARPTPSRGRALRGNDGVERASAGSPVVWPQALLAALLLAAVAYAGWDYHRVSQLYLPASQRAAAYQDDAWDAARRSWLFADVVRFAEVTSQPVTRDNAAWMLPAALRTLHFSPEARVATRVIESAALLGRDELALAHLARFKAAFPQAHRAWAEANAAHRPATNAPTAQ